MKGIERLLAISPKFIENIGFSVTLTNDNQVMDCYRFFSQNFPHNPARMNFARSDDLKIKKPVMSIKPKDFLVLKQDYAEGIRRNDVPLFLKLLFDGSMSRIFLRSQEYSGEDLFPTGFCPTGTRKLFVKPDGDFYACEKLGYDSFCIGDVDHGIDEQQSFELMDFTQDFSEKHCSNCWAARLCDSCIMLNSVKEGKPNMSRLEETCQRKKDVITHNLGLYTSLFKEFGESFINYLIELKRGHTNGNS